MVSVRSNLINYVVGGMVLILGIFALILPSFFIAVATDIETSPTDIPVLVAGAVLGLPAMGAGVTLIQERYRATVYLGLFAGILYAIIPAALFQSPYPPYYVPTVIMLTAVLTALMKQRQ